MQRDDVHYGGWRLDSRNKDRFRRTKCGNTYMVITDAQSHLLARDYRYARAFTHHYMHHFGFVSITGSYKKGEEWRVYFK